VCEGNVYGGQEKLHRGIHLRCQEKVQETNVPIEINPSVLTTFLETCMKLLHDRKSVKGLQELINKCIGKENSPNGHCAVRKFGKHKVRTRRNMRLTMQIGEYDMDQFIWIWALMQTFCLNKHGREWGDLHCSGL